MTFKRLYLFVALAACCLLAGCSPQQTETSQSNPASQSSQTEIPTESQPEIVPEVEPLPLEIQAVDSHYVYDQDNSQDLGLDGETAVGTLDIAISYPEIVGEGDVVEAINDQFVQRGTQVYDWAITMMNQEDYWAALSHQVSYNDGRWLSVLFTHYSYGEGAAHPETALAAENFALDGDGTPLTLEDLFGDGDYWPLLVEGIANSQEFALYEGILTAENLADTKDIVQFYLSQEGLVLFYQTYDLGPYALGAPSFTLGWDSIQEMLVG